MTLSEKFTLPRRWLGICAALGVLGLLLTAVGGAFDLRRTMFSYLYAFLFWLTFCLGALFTLTIFHTAQARWPVVFRRPLEWMALATLVFIPLFLPIALGLPHLFSWVSPPPELDEHVRLLLVHKRPYLNPGAFLLRAGVYFVLWGAVAALLHRWSLAQDLSPRLDLVRWKRRPSAAALPFLGITLSFAALDWVLSLDPVFNGSSLFGVYLFSGAMVACLSTLAIAGTFLRGNTSFGAFVTPAHFLRLGTLLLGFVCFWAYCAYSQGMLIWIANIPHETPWLMTRIGGGWAPIAVLLTIANFALPFLLLLFRKVKARRLGIVGAALLGLHAIDLYWMVLPNLHRDGPHLYFTDLTALLGIGGVTVAFTLWLARGEYALPVNEPYLPHSLEVPLP